MTKCSDRKAESSVSAATDGNCAYYKCYNKISEGG